MNFQKVKTRKESLLFPIIWMDAKSNPQHFFDENKKIVSFDKLEKVKAFLRKERPLLCRIGLKKFPKVGYVKSVSKTDYNILE
ncbi:hypothetical protein [Carboxylicivirga linearis]|uniref:Uncharacterized protein n=1 Tax=Carboxylicivirga linearis TaxID=1628157 RepID=A0ABS5K0M6_9BACT|nr:hypothetical protein [Carboxylicivirga linearis]MBS2100679.1 hypothetical protein [Carboxylicivirga linearis]